jgi:hypothetical protein
MRSVLSWGMQERSVTIKALQPLTGMRAARLIALSLALSCAAATARPEILLTGRADIQPGAKPMATPALALAAPSAPADRSSQGPQERGAKYLSEPPPSGTSGNEGLLRIITLNVNRNHPARCRLAGPR